MKSLPLIVLCTVCISGCIETQTDFVAANEVVITAQSRTLLNDNVSNKVLQQAAKVTRAGGYRYFEILGADDASRQANIILPGRATSNGTVMVSGSMATYSDTATYTPPAVMGVILPGEQIRIRMFRDGDAEAKDPRVFDADQILRR
jgi:hypothetical protein